MEKILLGNALFTKEYAFAGGSARLQYAADGPCGTLEISLPYEAAFGGGERFDTVNLKGHVIENKVEEKFCEQGGKTYCPIPFFYTESGFGLYAATDEVTRFSFGENIKVQAPAGSEIILFSGDMQTILAEFMGLFGPAKLPPEWAFLPWISANHWDTQAKAEEQIQLLRQHDFPAGVIVLEAWSDEATFYIFNGARYTPKEDGAFCYDDFAFAEDGPWPDPQGMIDRMHAAGLRVVLWQIPVYKKQEAQEMPNLQNKLDAERARAQNFCVANGEGGAYTIPAGHWFAGLMVPDFTNPAAKRDWFAKRQYLLDMGVDGFKTDGGEFIYNDEAQFCDGRSGVQMKNAYAQSYTAAYSEFLSEGNVLFSRAGYSGQHTTPILWAGDQKSTFDELRAQLRAGLAAGMSGVLFWGFDIGGFAGPLPQPELYLRATQLACFCPVMQWHSEPDGGQFREVMATQLSNNERSPWNIAKAAGEGYLEKIRCYHKLRGKLLPYLYAQAQACAAKAQPLLRTLAYAWPQDENTYRIDDAFMLGDDLLVAPILHAGQKGRQLYLPAGEWREYFTGENYTGGQSIAFTHEWHIPVFMRAGQSPGPL